jgi:putative ABC transport system permease protein
VPWFKTTSWNEAVQLAFQALQANKMRAILTMLGVTIGSASIVLVVTTSLAAKRYIISEIEAVGSNLVQAELVNPGTFENIPLADRLTTGDLRAVQQQIPQVRNAAGTNDLRLTLVAAGTEHPVSLVGVTEDFDEVRRLVIVKGRYFDSDDMVQHSKTCLITEQLASSVFAGRDPVDKDIAIGELHFTVVGVFRERVATFGLTEITDESAIIPFPLTKEYTGADYFQTLYAQADTPEHVSLVTARVAQVLQSRHRHGAKYRVWNLAGILEAARSISRALTVLLILVALIAVLIGGIGIMNIMLVTVTERTHEIGIRKAIGATRSAILCQFLLEAVLISGTGALAGVAIGILIAMSTTFLLRLPVFETILGDATSISKEALVPISWVSVLFAFIVSCSIGLVFGYLPARRAAKLQPTESLRYE